ncbi:MAG: thrombospondin type 3 repeat-containing protein [Myxococcota bacterium]|nr:thrombospondin type 3 repeat-containing protein [Myxococcota bacterium]
MDSRSSTGTGTILLALLLGMLPALGAQAAEEVLANGDSPTADLSPVGDVDGWSFGAFAGDTIQVQIGVRSGTDFQPVLELFDPNGMSVTSNSGTASTRLNHQALLTGQYRVEVSDTTDDGTGTYQIYLGRIPGSFVVPPGDEGGALVNGDVHPGDIDLGDLDLWTYEADALDTAIIQIGEAGVTPFSPLIALYGPDGILINSNGGNVSANLTHQATVAGTYTVVIRDNSGDVTQSGSYELYFANIPGGFVVPAGDEGGALTNGDVHAGTIDLGDLDLWSFQAAELDTLIVQIGEVGVTPFDPAILLYGPDGNFIDSNGGSVSANLSHQTTTGGTYTVVVRDNNLDVTGSGDYNLYFAAIPGSFVVPVGDEGGALTNGDVNAGTIDLGDIDLWTTEADALDALIVQIGEVGTTSFAPAILLYGPDGNLITSNAGNASANLSHQATVGGTYTVVVRDNNLGVTGSGDYNLYSARIPGGFVVPVGDEGGALSNGDVHSGTIDLGDVDLWTTDADALDTLIVQIAEVGGTGFSPAILLYGPDGSLITSNGGSTSANLAHQATLSGTYTVVVRDNNLDVTGTGDYNLYFVRTPGSFTVPSGDEGGALSSGVPVQGDIDLADLDPWTFDLEALDSALISIMEVTTTAFDPRIALYGPDGALINSSSGGVMVQLNHQAVVAGTYTVVVSDGNLDVTGVGDYELTLTITPDSTSPPAGAPISTLENGGVVSGDFDPSTDIDIYELPVSAGDQVRLQLSDASGNTFVSPNLQVFSAGGSLLASASDSTLARVAFLATSTETLTVVTFNGSTGTGPYDFFTAIAPGAFVTPGGDEGGPLGNGDVASGSWTLGDMDLYSLDVSAGDQVRLQLSDASGNTFVSPRLQVFSAAGALLAATSDSTLARVTFRAESSETLTVLAFNNSTGTGPYDFFTAIAPGAFVTPGGDEGGPLGNGDVAGGNWTLGDMDLYSLDVSAGDPVRLQLSDASGNTFVSPRVQVFSAAGLLLAADSNSTLARVNFRAESTETLTVLAFNDSTAVGDYDLFTANARGAFLTPAGDEGGTLTSGVTVNANFTLGDIDLYSLAVLEGDAVDISVTDVGAATFVSPVVEVYAADGSLIAAASSSGTASVGFTAFASEALRLFVYNSSTGTGPYDLLANAVTPVDSDGDGLSDEAELAFGTAPGDTDSDDDGISDFDEVNFDGDRDYNPALDLDPLNPDTDGDGFTDAEELAAGSDPLDPSSVPVAVPLLTLPGTLLLAALLLLSARWRLKVSRSG